MLSMTPGNFLAEKTSNESEKHEARTGAEPVLSLPMPYPGAEVEEGEDDEGEVEVSSAAAPAADIAGPPTPAAAEEADDAATAGKVWWEAEEGVVGAEAGVWPTLTKLSLRLWMVGR